MKPELLLPHSLHFRSWPWLSLVICLCLSVLQAQAAEVIPRSPFAMATAGSSQAKPTEQAKDPQQEQQKHLQKYQEQRLDYEQRLEALHKQLQEAPRALQEARAQLAERKRERQPEQTVSDSLSLERLEQLLEQQSALLNQLQTALTTANSQMITAQTRPERAQTEISNSLARQQEIESQLKTSSSGQQTLLQAESQALDALITLRREELSGNEKLLDLASVQRELLSLQTQSLERQTLELQNRIGEKRRAQSEQTVEQLSRQAEQAGANRLLAAQSRINLQLSDYLLKATTRSSEVSRLNLQTSQQLDTVRQTGQALDEQINILKDSLLLSRILYQQKQSLPRLQLADEKKLADEIGDIRLYQFELGQLRQELSNPQDYLDQLLQKQSAEPASPELRRALLEQIETRNQLLNRLNRELSTLLNACITLQLNQKQLRSSSQNLSTTLEEQMFWIPSNKPLSLDWFGALPQRFYQQLLDLPWNEGFKAVRLSLTTKPWLLLPLLLLAAVLYWSRRWFSQKLQELHKDIGHFRRDSQLHTPLALLLNLLLALPGAALFSLAGLVLKFDTQGQNLYLADACFGMAHTWLVFYTAYRIMSPGGVAERHFQAPHALATFLRNQIRWLGLIVLVLVCVVAVAEHQPISLNDDVVGQSILMLCYLSMFLLLVHLLRKGPKDNRLTVLIGLAFSLLPAAMLGAIAMGYYYTTLRLSDRLVDTLYVLLLWLLLQSMLVRGLQVAARRLAYQRAMSKRATQAKEDIDGSEVVEEPILDIQQVNQQSLRLGRLGLLIMFLVALYWVWADLLTVFSYLNQVALYENTSASGEIVPISLSDVLRAMVIIILTMTLARNLPGLLEMLVLSRLNLAQGSAYATSTLLSYLIIGVGTVSTLSTLGVSWNKLQWLVAALSVGLGFGLQEIFANFISGLIILFERPVRIGDTVTIGTLSGTVSRIRIRATTITDFDRKEIIVPNKTFITDQLLNWSLSDTVTRVTLKIGVAYGSDLELVRRLLLQAAEDNERVLKDPVPLVYFLSFSEKALEHELRIHVRELGDRNPVLDEINRVIDREFREHGITIAFRRAEVVLSNANGNTLQIGPPAAEPPPATGAQP